MSPSSPLVAHIRRTCTPRAVLAAKTPEAVKASSSGCAKQASMRNGAMSSFLIFAFLLCSPGLSGETSRTPGDKTTLDDKDMGVTEVLQGRNRPHRFVTTATVEDQRDVLGGGLTHDLVLQQAIRTPLRPRNMGGIEGTAVTCVDDTE